MASLCHLPVARAADASEIQIAYRVVGECSSDKTPLFVPAMSWLEHDLDALCANRTVVFFDVRGRGRSSRVEGMDDLDFWNDVADIERLRAHLAQTNQSMARIDLLGWSYYGGLVARYGLDYADRTGRLVLVGPSPLRSKPWFGRFLDSFARRIDLSALQELEVEKRAGLKEADPLAYGRRVHEIFHRAYVVDEGVLANMRSDPCVEPNIDAERVNDQARRLLEKLGDYDWGDDLRGLSSPVLLVHGREDPIPWGASEEWASILPHGQLALLENVGHMPWLEAPRMFQERVAEFLGSARV